jgi:hypothetical protein
MENHELANFQRQNSSTITNQGTEGTCYAHACSRVILNFIRRIIPDEFYPLEENDGCGNIEINTGDLEAEKYIENVFYFSESCSEKNKKNILLFAYIFTLIKNFFGCKGEGIIIVLRWFRKSFEYFPKKNDSDLAKGKFFDTSTNKKFFEIFQNFNDEKYEIVEKLLEKFKTEMTLKKLGISEYKKELEKDYYDDIGLIKYILDEQLYIVLTGNKHAVTAIGYEETKEDFFIILKNSWGNKPYDNFFGLPNKDGKLIINIDAITDRRKIDTFYFLLPQDTNIPRSEVLDEKDKEYRTKAKAKLINCNTNEDCKLFGKNGICDLEENLCFFDSKEGGKKKKTKKRKESKNKRKAKKNSKSQKNFKRKNV